MINVSAIKLPEAFDIYKDTDGEKKEFLEPVSKINIFVGSNNSGKSRFMRELSKQENYFIKIPQVDLENINSEILNYISSIEDLYKEKHTLYVNDVPVDELERIKGDLPNALNISSENFITIKPLIEKYSNYQGANTYIRERQRSQIYGDDRRLINTIIKDKAKEILPLVNEVPDYKKSDMPKQVYIPTLRGLRQLDAHHTDFYQEKTINDYFPYQFTHTGRRVNPEIFTGLTLFQRITDLLLGNNSERKLISNYQEFISETLFEGKSVALIPNQKEKVVIVKIGNEKEQPIHHLGDGIQSAIILSFLPFVMQEQTFFFIEEPEMYLHPGLQRKIMEFYAKAEECKNHTFFLTTHSNHFLDITIDIKDVSIFTFNKILDESGGEEQTPNFAIEAVDSGCESSLELLGVRNSSVFLVNATIWVEGITDRWYLRKMLNSYMEFLEENEQLKKRLEEDTHYSFVEYGGANITHWSFLDSEKPQIEVERLCAKAFVIIDKDGEGKKETRKEALQEKLKERLVILPCREVENLLPYSVIKQVVTEYEKNPELELKDYDYSKYQNIYLGKFIQDTMLKKNPSRKGGYKADSGTIKNKVDFCEKALPKIKYEELPDSTKEIVKNIYDFIYGQNIR